MPKDGLGWDKVHEIIGKRWDSPDGPVIKTPRFQCRDLSSIPGQGTKIPYAVGHGQKMKK